MRGVRRSARGESSRKAAADRDRDREVERFTLCPKMSHLTRATSEPCRRARGAASARRSRPFSAFELVSVREAGRAGSAGFSAADRAYLGRQHIPTKGPWGVDDVDSEAYVSQFSADGSLLIAGFRGSRIRVYDAEKGWKVQKDISCRMVHWTISDIALSPDQRFLFLTFLQESSPGPGDFVAITTTITGCDGCWTYLVVYSLYRAYASLSPTVHIVNVQSAGKESHANITEIHEGLDLTGGDEDEEFGIFSVKFSKDGKEIVVGNNERSIYVYDLAANKVSARIRAHKADVNAVTFADESGNVLYSGSDDSFCKVWDRRCLSGEKSAGVLTGHLDGVTFIDSRGDGRYFISNCKDQRIKLWDIRKMSSIVRARPVSLVDWDYRWMPFPSEAHYFKHPDDQSVATYKGHSVLRTLIRCYFSPVHSTGQRYIYTGSSDKSVHIYDVVSGKTVKRLSWHASIIRDCTWHPYYPTLVSSSWDGYVARWEASGDDDDPSMLVHDEKRSTSYLRRYGDPFM